MSVRSFICRSRTCSSVRPSVCPFVRPSARPSVQQPDRRPSVRLSVRPPVPPYTSPTVVRLSVCPSVRPSICTPARPLSVCPFVQRPFHCLIVRTSVMASYRSSIWYLSVWYNDCHSVRTFVVTKQTHAHIQQSLFSSIAWNPQSSRFLESHCQRPTLNVDTLFVLS